MALILPQPPKSRGIWGLLVTLVFVGWTGWQLTSTGKNTGAKPLVAGPVSTNTKPVFMEIDLRGPHYDVGRYEGWQKGQEAKAKGVSPDELAAAFSVEVATKGKTLDRGQAEDFQAGYLAGFNQALAGKVR